VGCPKVSSLSRQNFVPLGAGVPFERGRRRGVPPKRRHFDVIGSNNVKTVAALVTSFLKLSTSMTLNDLEPSQKGFLWIFRNIWMLRTFQHWIAPKWLEIDLDISHMTFLA